MKNKFNLTLVVVLLTITGSYLLNACSDPTKKVGEENSYTTTSTSLCDSTWFPHSQTPPPEEGKGSPFDTSSTTNLIFHQWSWQKFLWLTRPMTNGKAFFEDSLTLVTNELQPVSPQMGTSLVLTDIGQAGSGGVLMSNPTYNGQTDTVYYGIYVNQLLLDESEIMRDIILMDTNMLNNRATYSVGALEVKTSWIPITSIPTDEQGDYYITTAYITSLQDTQQVALLGMHVVGVVENHPEFIWATFEHRDLAAFYDWSATTNQDVPVTSTENLPFFDSTATSGIAAITYTPPPSPQNIFTVFQYGIPRTAGNAFMPNTSQDSATDQSNLDHIEGLNACVAANLSGAWKHYFYNGSVWLNTDGKDRDEQIDFMLAGGDTIGTPAAGTEVRGSLAAFNITMETFDQTFGVSEIHSMTDENLTNCMSCHSTSAKIILGTDTFRHQKSLFYFSHLFRSYMSKSSGVSISDIEKLRIQEFIESRANPNGKKKE